MESLKGDIVNKLLSRIQELESRVGKLEDNAPLVTDSPTPQDADTGSVSYRGEVTLDEATYAYIWERPTAHLTAGSWDETMKHLAATAHPVRGRILQHLLHHHRTTVAELVEAGIASSAGTGYHHLAALQSAGWIQKDSHGVHSIKPKRVVALLTLILAMEEA